MGHPASHFCLAVSKKPASRIAVSLLILGLLLSQVPLDQLWATVRRISLPLWAGALSLFVLAHAVSSFKWRLLANIGHNKLSAGYALRCHFTGLFANLFLPSLAGGDLVRATMAANRTGETTKVIWGSLLDRFLDTCSLVFIILVGALLLPGVLQAAAPLLWIGLLAATFPLGAAIALYVPLPKNLPQKLAGPIQQLRQLIRSLGQNPTPALIALVISLGVQSGFVLLNALLGSFCGIDLPLAVWLFAWPVAKLAAMLPISLGGLGVREVALAALLSRFDIPAASAVGVGLVWETILLGGGIIGGLSYAFSGQKTADLASASVETRDQNRHKFAGDLAKD